MATRTAARRSLAAFPGTLLAACLLAGSASAAPKTVQTLPVQVADAGPLQARPDAPAAPVAVSAHVQKATFEAAPIPDPDAAAPNTSREKTASLMPSLFHEKGEFEGDGYSYNSDQSSTLERRKTPAAGFNLSVPMK